jgi:predicted ATP-binding protein involved in virulence
MISAKEACDKTAKKITTIKDNDEFIFAINKIDKLIKDGIKRCAYYASFKRNVIAQDGCNVSNEVLDAVIFTLKENGYSVEKCYVATPNGFYNTVYRVYWQF